MAFPENPNRPNPDNTAFSHPDGSPTKTEEELKRRYIQGVDEAVWRVAMQFGITQQGKFDRTLISEDGSIEKMFASKSSSRFRAERTYRNQNGDFEGSYSLEAILNQDEETIDGQATFHKDGIIISGPDVLPLIEEAMSKQGISPLPNPN